MGFNDHTEESKFNRYMLDKYRQTGRVASLREYEATWYTFLETHNTEDGE